MKNKKIIIIAAVVLALAGSVYYLYFRKPQTTEPEPETIPQTPVILPPSAKQDVLATAPAPATVPAVPDTQLKTMAASVYQAITKNTINVDIKKPLMALSDADFIKISKYYNELAAAAKTPLFAKATEPFPLINGRLIALLK